MSNRRADGNVFKARSGAMLQRDRQLVPIAHGVKALVLFTLIGPPMITVLK